jgi:hypothetical protein
MNKDWNTSDDILGAGGAGNFKFIRSWLIWVLIYQKVQLLQ